HDGELAAVPVDARTPDHHRLAETGLQLRLGETLRVRTQVEEAQRILTPHVRGFFHERTLVCERCDARTRVHREVVPALRADPERPLELVVAVVRLAPGARVRMLLAVRLRRVAVLDRDVDPGRGHRSILDRGPFWPVAGGREGDRWRGR